MSLFEFFLYRGLGGSAGIDECISAMENNVLPVDAQHRGRYLWEWYVLERDQLTRICVLLQQLQLPPSLLRRPLPLQDTFHTYAPQIPGVVSTLCDMEYLWQHLEAVDACIGAMEGGVFPVDAKHKQNGLYLWEYFILTTDQWARICVLLQTLRLPPRLLWRPKWISTICWTRSRNNFLAYFVSRDFAAMITLCHMEYLWQDLDAVEAWMEFMKFETVSIQWVADEVDRRRRWFSGPRRAWLAAIVVLFVSTPFF